jgi:hypothetical protein
MAKRETSSFEGTESGEMALSKGERCVGEKEGEEERGTTTEKQRIVGKNS